ncbi:MAG: 30S ribosomal protein S1 [Bacteroidetes bacterium SW_10_40_5]|nr:MAG: 30S ribosomal protein S1 [Bacteroidetes bacterium SW_10_40_5]
MNKEEENKNVEHSTEEDGENQGSPEQTEQSKPEGTSQEAAGFASVENSEQTATSEVEGKDVSEIEIAELHIPENIQPKEDFDWEKFEEGEEEYSKEEKKELEQLYTQNLSIVEDRQLVTGKVVNITDRDVVLNIGFKSDGLVQLSEFKDKPDLKVGDEVEVLVEQAEDREGQLHLSHKKAIEEKAWGTIVDSHEDIKPIKDYDAFVGQTMDLKVVKLNLAFRNIVVSHKAIIESDLEQQKSQILSDLEKGQVLEGTVKNLTSFGVFVDLGGVDGLIHITDVSWGRINHPEEVLELGQKINVVVLYYDEEKKRISLGLKQLYDHPWDTLPDDIQESSKVTGKVVNIEDYGAFVEIHPGVEGLVHVSEMSWSQHLKSPEEYVNLGDEVETVVLSIDREERKLSLGMKQLTEDPWEQVEEKYTVGSQHNATVRSVTNFGLFVELEEGIDGLFHFSDLSWTKKYNHPNEFTKVGEQIDVVVLEIDKNNRRLSLGVKQLEEDPWDTFESIFLVDSVHEGGVEKIEDKGAIISLPYSVEAFAPNKHLMKEDKNKLQEEETLQFKVIEFDKENRRIVVSHTDIWKEEERARKEAEEQERKKEETETKKDVKNVKSKIEQPTLGEEYDSLKTLKSQLEETEKQRQQEAMQDMEEKMKNGEEEDKETSGKEAKAEVEEKPNQEEASGEEKTTGTETDASGSTSNEKSQAKSKSKKTGSTKSSSTAKQSASKGNKSTSAKSSTTKQSSSTKSSSSSKSGSTKSSTAKTSTSSKSSTSNKSGSGSTNSSTSKSSSSKSTGSKSTGTKSSTTKKSSGGTSSSKSTSGSSKKSKEGSKSSSEGGNEES